MTPAYELKSTAVSLGGERVLGPLDLRIEQGGFCIIVGPNGSGKTTLLRTLAGHIRGYTGSIRLFGEDLVRLVPARLALKVSHLPQFPLTDVPFTVEMAVQLGRAPRLGLLGLERKEDLEAAGQAMAMTKVLHLRTRRLSTLSGGELSRALLAQALCREPEVLLLDEPTASLDPGHQMAVMDMLESIRSSRRTTIVMISHDLNVAATYGKQLVLLKNGRAVKMGPPGEVLTTELLSAAYEWRMVADVNPLTGAPRVSALPGRKHHIP